MPGQETLPQDRIVIFADNREFKSKVVRELALMDCVVKPQQLEIGDFILSDRVAVERKTTADFLDSIFDQRLFEQLPELNKAYDHAILLIEGENLYSQRNVHPNSIRGALSSVALDYRVPILWTANENETAGLLYWMAKREQEELERRIAIRSGKRTTTIPEHQEFLVAGLPDINRVRAKALLEHFGSPEGIFHASEEELKDVAGIGKVLAKRIRRVLTEGYEASNG